MPELPEVETMCRGIRHIVGQTIEQVLQPPCAYRPIRMQPSIGRIAATLQGLTIEEVTRLGKRVVLGMGDWALILQPKMTGLVTLAAIPDQSHLRLQVDFVAHQSSLYFWDRRGLGTVEMLKSGEIQQRLIDGRLGPDALAIGCGEFCTRLSRVRRPIKVALLDQRVLAGVGNLYASEILFTARIHPARQAARLSRPRKLRLYNAMREILQTAIRYEGSTLADGTYRDALNNPGKYQNQHQVYARAGSPCPRCGQASIRRIVQAQRATFYCPRCQRL